MFTNKNKIVSKKINISNNPFAYIRNEKAVNCFATNLVNSLTTVDTAEITKDAKDLLEVASLYLVTANNAEDQTMDNLKEIMKAAADYHNENIRDFVPADNSIPNTFGMLIRELTWDEPEYKLLKTKYKTFTDEVGGEFSERYMKAVDVCNKALEDGGIPEILLKGLNPDERILQLEILMKNGKRYDFRFCETDGAFTKVRLGYHFEENRIAEILSNYPFYDYFEGADPLSKGFLMHIINLTEAVHKKMQEEA